MPTTIPEVSIAIGDYHAAGRGSIGTVYVNGDIALGQVEFATEVHVEWREWGSFESEKKENVRGLWVDDLEIPLLLLGAKDNVKFRNLQCDPGSAMKFSFCSL